MASLAIGVLIALSPGASAHGLNRTKKGGGGTKPAAIIPGPSGLLSGGTSVPDLTFWVLASHGHARNIQLISRVSGHVVKVVPESSAANTLLEVPYGPLLVGRSIHQAGSLEIHSSTTGALQANVPLTGPARSIAASANGATYYVLVTSRTASSVEVISAASHTVSNTLPVSLGASAIVFNDAQQTLFVLSGNQDIDVVNPASGQIESMFTVSPPARAIALSPDDTMLYVLRGSRRVSNIAVINVAKQAQLTALPAPSNCNGIQLTSDDNYLIAYVGSSTTGNIQLYSLHK